MNCNMKTMLKVGVGMLFVTGIAYAAFPHFRALILAASPTLLFLLCPLSMLLCMKMMNGQNSQSGKTTSADENQGVSSVPINVDVQKN